jgi:hypothetical protein
VIERNMRNGKRAYGEWAGNPRGTLENVTRCIEGVYSNGSYIESQCARPRGHGHDGLYCKQHAKRYPADLKP